MRKSLDRRLRVFGGTGSLGGSSPSGRKNDSKAQAALHEDVGSDLHRPSVHCRRVWGLMPAMPALEKQAGDTLRFPGRPA